MAIELRVKWRGSRKAKKELDKLRKSVPSAVMGAAMKEANEVMKISKQLAPQWRGRLIESAFVRRKGLQITLGYDSPYAAVQHEGWPVGLFPSIEGLKPWAEAVLGDASLAFPVARQIAEQGFRGQPRKFLEKPLKERLPGMARRIARRARKGL